MAEAKKIEKEQEESVFQKERRTFVNNCTALNTKIQNMTKLEKWSEFSDGERQRLKEIWQFFLEEFDKSWHPAERADRSPEPLHPR